MDIKSFFWTTIDFFDSEGQVTARGCATKDKVIVDASEIKKQNKIFLPDPLGFPH